MTDDALTRTNTSLVPTITGDLELLVSIKSSMVPYEWTCHAIILDDHVVLEAVASMVAEVLTVILLQVVTAVNVRRIIRVADEIFNDEIKHDRQNINRIVFDLGIIFHISNFYILVLLYTH